jgi:uncharacterized protein with PIN domain
MRPKFIVDINVGRLATWLRIMGYDTAFPRNASDNELVRLALKQDRLLITRDAGFLLRRSVCLGQIRMLYVVADDLRGQLRQLMQELQLNLDNGFSRCLRCNELLTNVEKAAVADRIPDYVARTQTTFSKCSSCRRVYWPGTHWSNMIDELARASRDGGSNTEE